MIAENMLYGLKITYFINICGPIPNWIEMKELELSKAANWTLFNSTTNFVLIS